MNSTQPKDAEYLCDGLYYKRSLNGVIFMWLNEGWTKSQKTWEEVKGDRDSVRLN